MKIAACPECKKIEEALKANPIGGCVTCALSAKSDKEGDCKECFETYDAYNHYPKWRKKNNV